MFERICFTRGEQTLVFRPLSHMSKKEWYLELKSEVDDLVSQGYQLLVECVKGLGTVPEGLSRMEIRLAKSINNFHCYAMNVMGKASGNYSQESVMNYPEYSCLRVDATYLECIREFTKYGVEVTFWLPLFFKSKLFTYFLNQENVNSSNRCKSSLRKINEVLLKKSGAIKYFSFHSKVFFDYRNEVAVAKIEAYFSDKPAGKALLHFGRGHQVEITKHLLKNNWTLNPR